MHSKPVKLMGRTTTKVDTPKLPEGAIWNGNPRLIPFLVPVGDLHEDVANARSHPERSIHGIASSYKNFGQQKWLVCDENLTVRDGNGQFVAAARVLGWTHIAAVPSNLDGIEITRYALAVNRTGELSEWDFERLSNTLRGLDAEGADITEIGWADYEIEPLLQADWQPPSVEPMPSSEGREPSNQVAPVVMTAAQRLVFDQAAELVREREGDDSLDDGECLERICSEFLGRGGKPS